MRPGPKEEREYSELSPEEQTEFLWQWVSGVCEEEQRQLSSLPREYEVGEGIEEVLGD